jgi:hypothetical protein
MEKVPRTVSWEVNEAAVKRMLSGERPTALSRELGARGQSSTSGVVNISAVGQACGGGPKDVRKKA